MPAVTEPLLPALAGSAPVLARPMRDHTPDYATAARDGGRRVRAALRRDGYLRLRSVLPCDAVLAARRHIVDVLACDGLLRWGTDPMDAVALDPARSAGLLQRSDVASAPPVRAVLEHPALYALMQTLLATDGGDGDVATVEYKWLRAVGHGGFTGVHTDRVYLGRGTDQLLTAWIPLGRTDPTLGSMLVAAGSHRSRRFAELQRTYGRGTVGSDGVESGWLSSFGLRQDGAAVAKQLGFEWHTAVFEPGDICVLTLDLLHISSANQTDRYRISCDTRWQLRSEPVDPRLRLAPPPESNIVATTGTVAPKGGRRKRRHSSEGTTE